MAPKPEVGFEEAAKEPKPEDANADEEVWGCDGGGDLLAASAAKPVLGGELGAAASVDAVEFASSVAGAVTSFWGAEATASTVVNPYASV